MVVITDVERVENYSWKVHWIKTNRCPKMWSLELVIYLHDLPSCTSTFVFGLLLYGPKRGTLFYSWSDPFNTVYFFLCSTIK